jgi:hypothetical protein
MKRCMVFLFLAPYITDWAPPDSSYDEVQIGAGGGQYVYKDCSGEHTDRFSDGGARITHKFEAPFRIGAAVSLVPSDGHTVVVPYPDLAFDNGYLSLGTTGLRLGRIDDTYFELRALDDAPFATGRGLFRCGVGLPLAERGMHLWIGANRLPYENWGAAAGLDFKLANNRFIVINGRYGEHGNVPEFGLSLGLRLRY